MTARAVRRVLAVALGSGAMVTCAVAVAMAVPATDTSPTDTSPTDTGSDSAEPGLSVDVSLRTVSPAALHPGDTLVLAGSVTNTGSEPLENALAMPRYSITPLDSRDQIDLVDSDRTFRRGSRPASPFEELEFLEPGQSAEFTLELPVDSIGFGAAGVYVVGIDVRADDTTANALTDRITVGDTRTVVPYLTDDEPLPQVPVASIWGLETEPRLGDDGTLDDEELADELATELGADGRLGGMLDAGGEAPVTWLVDPDLLLSVEALADHDADTTDVTTGWWDSFTAARAAGDTLLAPAADPDIESFLGAESALAERLLDTAVATTDETAARLVEGTLPPDRSTDADPDDETTDEALSTPVAGPVARLADGTVGPDALDAYTAAGVDEMILPSGAVDPAPGQPFAEIATDNGPVRAVVTDPGLDAALADVDSDAATGDDPRGAATHLTQRWRAATAMIALDAQQAGTTPQPLVAAAPPGWDPSAVALRAAVDVWTTTPWIAATTLDGLDRPASPPEIEPAADVSTGVLPLANVTATEDLDTTVRHFTAMIADLPDDAANPAAALDLAVLRSASRSWQHDPEAGVAFTAAITDRVAPAIREVTLSAPEQVTLSSRTGVFPLTVDNPLDFPVSVRIAVSSANPDRLRVDAVTEQVVDAGTRATIDVEAEALSNGRVPVSVSLVAADGAQLGAAQRTVITATDYGAAGWVVVAAGGVLLVWSLGRRAWRRRHPVAGNDTVLDDVEAGLDQDVNPEADRGVTPHVENPDAPTTPSRTEEGMVR